MSSALPHAIDIVGIGLLIALTIALLAAWIGVLLAAARAPARPGFRSALFVVALLGDSFFGTLIGWVALRFWIYVELHRTRT